MEEVVAAAQMQGGMIALRPTEPLTVEGGDPAEEIHVTLAFVAEDASEMNPLSIDACHRAAMQVAQTFSPIVATIAGYASLGLGDEPATVLILNGPDLQPTHDVIWSSLSPADFPEQHRPWIPHMTLGYGIDIDKGKPFVGQTVTFDRVTVDLGGEQTSYPLVGQPLMVDDSVTAASRQRKYGGGKFKSERQRRFMWAVVEDAAKKWAHNRSTRKSDWRGVRRNRTLVSDAEEVTMPEIVIGAATEEDIAVIMQCLVASGISLTLQGEPMVEVEEVNEEDLQASAAIVAAIGDAPPAEFFSDPQFAEGQRWVSVTADGRVSGHVALWGECHVGYPGRCITPEAISQGGFDYCNGIGHVVTAAGEEVGTSPLAVKGGHAPLEWDWKRAKAHYDDPSTVVADVVYGADEHGIWFSGALRPTATPEMVYALRASGVSGDWREIDGQTRLLASCCVNNGGFPKMKARVNKAEDRVLAMVAAGGEAEPDPTLKCCGDIEVVEEAEPLGVPQMVSILQGNPITTTADAQLHGDQRSLEERLARLEAHYQNEVLASLADRLTID